MYGDHWNIPGWRVIIINMVGSGLVFLRSFQKVKNDLALSDLFLDSNP